MQFNKFFPDIFPLNNMQLVVLQYVIEFLKLIRLKEYNSSKFGWFINK